MQQQPTHGGPPPPHKPHAQQISLEKLNERGYHLEKQQPPSVQQSHIAENMYRMPMSLSSGMLTISPQSQQVNSLQLSFIVEMFFSQLIEIRVLNFHSKCKTLSQVEASLKVI